MMDRISICEALAKRREIDPFLKRMVTEGVGSAWPNTKFRSLLSTTGQFEARVWPELANRRGVAFHQDNARPLTSVVTHQNL
ncbi:hypothetical protein TNCV_909801 [Trichonephila clavipes]|nr:hypothetical protein TNCV_909801 [Trichonephila clavipes]